MTRPDLMSSIFDNEDEEGVSNVYPYIVKRTFRAKFKGDCNYDEDHMYRVGDFIGELESTTNPFVPVRGYCCNKCVRILPHKEKD